MSAPVRRPSSLQPNGVRGFVVRLRRFALQRLGSYRLHLIKRLVEWPVRALLRPVVPRIRRDPRLVAFGANSNRFADNPAYLFLHMGARPGLRCVWVSGSRETVDRLTALGLESVRRWSLQGIRVALRASWYVYGFSRADVNTLLDGGAVAFNLWHGVGVKRIGLSTELSGWKQPSSAGRRGGFRARLVEQARRSPDWVLSSSPVMSGIFATAFGIPVERCVELGYPRNDHLAEGSPPPPAMVDRELYEKIERARPVVGYFPTFRDTSATLPGGASIISEMSSIIAAQGGTLVFKAHNVTLLDEVDAPDAIVIPSQADLNGYLGLCDVLITDFSSVAMDYLVLRRPVVLFCPHYDEFADGRGFNFEDPIEMMPGVLTRSTDELFAALKDFRSVPVSNNTDELLRLYWDDTAAPGAGERVAQFIDKPIAS